MANGSVTPEQQELLDMLAGELQAQLELSLKPEYSSRSPECLQETAEVLNNFSNAADLIGLDGLAIAWRCLRENFLALTEIAAITNEQIVLIDSWVMYFLDFLQEFSCGNITADVITPVLQFLSNNDWPVPLNNEQQKQLAQALLNIHVVIAEEEHDRLPKIATREMLSLALSDDINPELFEGLMIELPAQVTQFSNQLNDFIHTGSQSALASAQRIAHTLKGSANVVGISGLANFMHYSEDLLEEMAKHTEPLTPSLANLLIDMSDTLAAMLDNLSSPEANCVMVGDVEFSVIQQVLDAYYAIAEKGFAAYEPPTHLIPVNPLANDISNTNVDEVVGVQPQTPNLHEVLSAHLRIKEDTAQDLLRLAGESAISTNRLQSQVQNVKTELQHIGQLHNKLTQLTEEFGYLIEVRELFSTRNKNKNDEGLDPLELDRYNELHSFFHQLQEFAIDTRDAIFHTQGQLRSLENLTFEQQVTNRASQHHLLEMRMIPANYFEARFQRCVRQACRLTGKQAQFVLRGGDTMIDSRVLHDVVDPLMHLLRNAVDHGVEFPQEREAEGKAREGLIELQFMRQGQTIVIRVVDDGAGLNHERIVQKAQELSLIPPTESNVEVNDLWLKQIIFAAGFSTRDHVTQTSGRGIGLDMVADRVNILKGRITVDSRPNRGCEFSIRLPMPMIAEQGLLIGSGQHRLVISSRGVEQLLFLDKSSLIQEGEQLHYYFDQEKLDVFSLAHVAQFPDVTAMKTADAQALLVVEILPGQRVGVLVERVMTNREMVVKPLTPFTPKSAGVIGATILGDGTVAPVIDIQHLVLSRLNAGTAASTQLTDVIRNNQQALVQKPMALIVDDSLSTRRSLAQFVGDMGIDVRTAKDGFEAIDILQEQLPHIMLVDMEMPRMNGLELTAHMRANEATRNIPVIMITSRNTEKHRNLAAAAGVDAYLNKPFSEEELFNRIQENIHA